MADIEGAGVVVCALGVVVAAPFDGLVLAEEGAKVTAIDGAGVVVVAEYGGLCRAVFGVLLVDAVVVHAGIEGCGHSVIALAVDVAALHSAGGDVVAGLVGLVGVLAAVVHGAGVSVLAL